ncbi:hypothetical protein TIFTF001_017057 [Ficus carica]|uniref:Uncharacterized protein n=1 Tax=Ficus carica TaxID=3494 RepID=A0AA88D7X3_FICCA|nr:hypothetical protein TIFTF001_017057 [Ficus carica]
MVFDEGLKRKQGEIEVKASKKLISAVEEKISEAEEIDPKFFALADNLDDFNDFPWGMLSWEATRAVICNTVENRMSSKRRSLKNQIHHQVRSGHSAMLSWITADNVKFDDVMSVFTVVGENQGKAHTAYYVSSSQKINVEMAESNALTTTSPDIGTGSQNDVFIDSDIGVVVDMGVQAAMEFLTGEKENIKKHLEGYEGEAKVKSAPFVQIKEESMPDLEKKIEVEKDDKESIREHDDIKLEESANEESIGDVVVTNICN